MTFVTRFLDNFDNGSVDLKIDNPNGASISEAGSSLTISHGGGTNFDWWNSVANAPVTYVQGLEEQPGGIMLAETRLTSYTWGATATIAGMALWDDRQNAYWIAWYPGNSNVYVQRGYNNSFGALANTSTGNPNTTPHRYRIYWNPSDEPRSVEVSPDNQAVLLLPGQVSFWYSDDDGASWNSLYTDTIPFAVETALKVGPFVKNGSSLPSFSADFDYLKIYQDDVEGRVVLPEAEAGKRDNSGIRQSHASMEDDGYVAEAGGPPVHQGDVTKGYLGPGPAEVPPGAWQRFDHASMEDDGYVANAGGPSVHQGDVTKGYLGPGPANRPPGPWQRFDHASMEDASLYSLQQADYQPDKIDADGYELLYGIDLEDALVIDTTAGGFGNPTANNHWGAAHDGKYYADGYECGTGGLGFGTLADGFNQRDWMFSGQEPFGEPLRASLDLTADDTVRFSGAKNGWLADIVTSRNKWYFDDGEDFDVQVWFKNWNQVSGTEMTFGLYVVRNIGGTEGTNQFYLYRYGGGYYEAARHLNNGWASLGTLGTSDTQGGLRITRVGNTYQAYTRQAGAWQALGSSLTHANLEGAVYVNIAANGNNNANLTVDGYGFTVNSGTITNRVGWYREDAGTHRGLQPDMPSRLGVLTSDSAIELLDIDNDKLWMRFIQGTNNAMGATAANVRAHRAVWDDGLLFVSYGNGPSDAEGGAALAIDFTTDTVRWHREQAAATTGGYYRGTYRADGIIALRNSASGGYVYDDDSWRIQDYRVWDIDVLRADGYEYRAVATQEGLAAFRWPRWYLSYGLDYALESQSAAMRWCEIRQDGYLFYMDESTLYGAAPHTWQDVLGSGAFSPDAQIALAGTQDVVSQYRAAIDGYDIYLPGEEGVYKATFPGAFSLFYGRAGSGATHEILPPYSKVLSVRLMPSGLLLCGLEGFSDMAAQLAVVDTATNTLWGTSKRFDVSSRGPVAVGF